MPKIPTRVQLLYNPPLTSRAGLLQFRILGTRELSRDLCKSNRFDYKLSENAKSCSYCHPKVCSRSYPNQQNNQVFYFVLFEFGSIFDSILTKLNKFGNSNFSMSFCFETQFFFYLDFYPKPLTIKAVLISLLITLHGLNLCHKSLYALPSMVNTHWIIGGDRAIHE